MKSLNLSKDRARAVVDIPVPATADLNRVTDVLREVAAAAMKDDGLPDLLLDVGRQLRHLVLAELRRAGVSSGAVVQSA